MKKPQSPKTGASKPASSKSATAKVTGAKTDAARTAASKSSSAASEPTKKASSARPPRHSRTTRKPITIDLEAEKSTAKPAATSTSSNEATGAKKPGSTAVSGSATASSGKPGTAQAQQTAASKSESSAAGKSSATSTTSAATQSSTRSGASAAAQAGKSTPSSASKSTPSKPVKKPSSGLFGKLVAAIIGGLVALGGAGLAQYVGLLGVPGQSNTSAPAVDPTAFVSPDQLNSSTTALSERLAALETQISDTASSSGQAVTDPAALAAAVDQAVSAKLAEAGAVAAPTSGAALTVLQEKANETDQKMAALTQSLADLEADVSMLSSSLSTGGAGENTSLAALDGRLSNVQKELDALRAAQADQSAAPIVAAVPSEIMDQITANRQESADNTSRLSDLTSRLSGLEQSTTEQKDALAGVVDAAAKSALSQPVAQLEARIAALAEQISGQTETVTKLAEQADSGADKKAARAIAAAALVNDINRGIPFANSLNVMRQFVDDTELSPLAPYAENGIVTASVLEDEFNALRSKLVAAGAKDAGQSPFQRLQAAARNLVKVQPLNPVEGDDAAAVASRIAAALKAQDLTKAEAQWAALPDASKAISRDWHASLAARVLADRLLTSSIQSFVMSGQEG